MHAEIKHNVRIMMSFRDGALYFRCISHPVTFIDAFFHQRGWMYTECSLECQKAETRLAKVIGIKTIRED